MTTATLATDNAISTEQQVPQPDRNRITERDPDYLRLRASTERQLTDSLARLVREVRRARHDTARVAQAQSAFIRRHTDLLRQAYIRAHGEGARDYFGAVSHRPERWARRVQPSGARMEQRLLFYAAGSVTRMANEAALAAHAQLVSKQAADTSVATQLRDAVSRAASQRVTGAFPFMRLADAPVQPGDALDAWFVGMRGRLQLQSEIAWNGLQDGYSDAGAVDPASPYTVLYWELGPVKTQHCETCPVYAAGSPYGRPGSGDNELNATPGDGHTDCGAACHCSLRYAYDWGALQRSALAGVQALDALGAIEWHPTEELPPEAHAGQMVVGQLLQGQIVPTEAGIAAGIDIADADYLPTDESGLREVMVQAMDRYRTAAAAYQKATAAALAADPKAIRWTLPDLQGANEENIAFLSAAWPLLTYDQSVAILDALGASISFALALDQAAAYGLDGLLYDVGYVRLAESWRGWAFIDYSHDPKTGRFAPTGGAGGAGGTGHADTARMARAVAQHRDAETRFHQAKAVRDQADKARRGARTEGERAQHTARMNRATEEMRQAQEDGKMARDEYQRAQRGLPAQEQERAQARAEEHATLTPAERTREANRLRKQASRMRQQGHPDAPASRKREGRSLLPWQVNAQAHSQAQALLERLKIGETTPEGRGRAREIARAAEQLARHRVWVESLTRYPAQMSSDDHEAVARHQQGMASARQALHHLGVAEADINQLAENDGGTMELADVMMGGEYGQS